MQAHDFELEKQHLANTIHIAQTQLDKAAQDSQRHLDTIRAIQEERMEDNPMDSGGMYSAQGFLDMLETSQGTQELTHALSSQERSEQTVRALARMVDAPYFARIDFQYEDGHTKPVYIGRSTLMDDDSMAIYVYDWRVPIASVFYQYGVGPAQFDAPAGTTKGEVLLKRQYEIQHGELHYYFDSDEQVLDVFLRDLLSKPAAPAMKSIVETIQRDQDRIIRNLQTDLLMVQGSAGSGKTSVALHRVAYLMYQGLQVGRLSPDELLILAPNATFEKYISQVLPDLGETQVQTVLLEDILSDIAPSLPMQTRGAWVESWLSQEDARKKERMRQLRAFKGSRAFLSLLDRFLHELPRKWIPFSDVEYDGQNVARAEDLRVSICNSTKKAPLGVQLRMLEKSIWRDIRTLRPARLEKLRAFAGRFPTHAMEVQAFARMLSIRESGRLTEYISAFTRIDCAALYQALFADKDAFLRLAKGLLPNDEAERIRAATLEELSSGAIPYEDAAAIAYLQVRLYGYRVYTHVRHVVVDEAQDLDALHTALLALLFPSARYTILGDIHQTLVGRPNLTLYDEIQATLRKDNSLLATLDKSFRCTREIWAFSAQFLPEGAAGECFSRSGEPPRVHRATNTEALDSLLMERIEDCRETGCQSIALLCKTQREARQLEARLPVPKGVSILSLYMAKGLEFDAVLLSDINAEKYYEETDKNLLYIGCTRALHRLELFFTGDRSPLLSNIEEERI